MPYQAACSTSVDIWLTLGTREAPFCAMFTAVTPMNATPITRANMVKSKTPTCAGRNPRHGVLPARYTLSTTAASNVLGRVCIHHLWHISPNRRSPRQSFSVLVVVMPGCKPRDRLNLATLATMGGVLPRIVPYISISSHRLDLTRLIGSMPSRTARRPTAARFFDYVGRACDGFWRGVLHSFLCFDLISCPSAAHGLLSLETGAHRPKGCRPGWGIEARHIIVWTGVIIE